METGKESRLKELRAEIEDLRRRLPAHRHKLCATKIVHSDPIELLMQLEEAEEELKRWEKREK